MRRADEGSMIVMSHVTMRFISQARIHLLTFRLEFLTFY